MFLDDPLGGCLAKTPQPRLPVGVGQRYAASNLIYIRWRMKVVGIGEFPPKLLRQQTSDSRFAGPNYAHHNHNHAEGF
jgi:hypothetical protein